MTPDSALDLLRQGLYVTVILVTALVLPGLLVGLLVAMFQAATQINEVSLSFVPKILITLFTILSIGPWISKLMLDYTTMLYSSIPSVIG